MRYDINVFVNGRGSTTLMELYIIVRKIIRMLSNIWVEIHRADSRKFPDYIENGQLYNHHLRAE
jgi:hypothetical protein